MTSDHQQDEGVMVPGAAPTDCTQNLVVGGNQAARGEAGRGQARRMEGELNIHHVMSVLEQYWAVYNLQRCAIIITSMW